MLRCQKAIPEGHFIIIRYLASPQLQCSYNIGIKLKLFWQLFTWEAISKVKVACRYTTACFHFRYGSKCHPTWKAVKRASIWYKFYRFTANVEVLRCRKAIPEGHFSRYLASPQESQIETSWSDKVQCNLYWGQSTTKLKWYFWTKEGYAYWQFQFHSS